MMKTDNRVFSGRSRNQRGFTLLEALIAFLILAAGLLAALRFHSVTIETTAEAKIRAEAVALAEQKVEEFRSFVDVEQYDGDTVDGAGLGDYAGVDYAADFTRNWTISGTNPLEIAVTVTWTDRAGADVDDTNQSIQVTSMVWRNVPWLPGDSLANAFLASSGGGSTPWDDLGGGPKGTGYGGGKVTIKIKGEDDNYYETEAEALLNGTTLVYEYYSVLFTGTIESVNGAQLLEVTLVGDGGNPDGTCGKEGDPLGPTAVIHDQGEDGDVWTNGLGEEEAGVWLDSDLRDNNGDFTGFPVASPYLYTCRIEEIPIDDTWSGTITYIGEQGAGQQEDEVCIPNEGSTTLRFDKETPPDLKLGVVLVDKKNLCKLFQ